jgi:peptidoglycan-N-acetylglucosamine deacetylase
MINRIFKSIVFRTLSLFCANELTTEDKAIYLTFDDGPEPGITEFVLNILNQHNAKATFFCTGENYEKYPALVDLIKSTGHSFGNHTYSHLNGLKENYKAYINDVFKSKKVIQSNLFRPPWGVLTIREYLKLRKDTKIILWKISSCDSDPNTNWEKQCQRMVHQTKSGSVVLFHFNLKHSNETMKILPIYLAKTDELNYKYYSIKG